MTLTLTINLKDGSEINDIEGEADGLGGLPAEIRRLIDANEIEPDEWSSLVVVVSA